MTYFTDLLKLVDGSITDLPTERDMFTRRQVVDLLLDLRNDVVQLEAFAIIQEMLRTGTRFRDIP
jgi:hypothetical protein